MVQHDDEEYLTANEVAQMLGVTRRTVDRYAAEGKLPRYRRGWRILFLRADVEALIEEQTEIKPYEDEEG